MITRKTMLLACLSLLSFSSALAQVCPREGPDSPLTLHKSWILEGWERREGDPDFVFADKMRRYYDIENPAGVFYDNFAPGETQLFRDGAVYGSSFQGLQNAARSVFHALTEANDEIVGDQVASTTLGFVGIIDQLDGEVIPFDARSQLGWACDNGEWKIRHELNYAEVVAEADVAPFFEQTEGAR